MKLAALVGTGEGGGGVVELFTFNTDWDRVTGVLHIANYHKILFF